MAYLILPRKYRPQTLEKVVGQEHVTQTLANSLSSNRVPQAILFSGPRGTGKTTIARILAKAINCTVSIENRPCNSCSSCNKISTGKGSDVFEIDGASNNSVEQIRNLQRNIRYLPIESQFKIYIIDEVHMLSGSAFNALLKTLEEPPQHIVFLFATTEYHKIPATIISRCQHHNLKLIGNKPIHSHLTQICTLEDFNIQTKDLWTIANKADGSMRDALSVLDQVMSGCNNNPNSKQINNILGTVNIQLMHEITEAVFLKNTANILDIINSVYIKGHDLKLFYNSILEQFRHLLVLKTTGNTEKLVNLPSHEIKKMQKQIENVPEESIVQILSILFREEGFIKNSNSVKLALEIAFLKLNKIEPFLSINTLIEKLNAIKKTNSTQTTSNNTIKIPSIKPIQPAINVRKQELTCINSSNNKTAFIKQEGDLDKVWQQFQNSIANSKPSLAASLSHCHIKKINDKSFEIEVTKNEYTMKVVKKNLDFIKQAFRNYSNIETTIVLQNSVKKLAHGSLKQNTIRKKIANHPLVADAIEVFDGKIESAQISIKKKE